MAQGCGHLLLRHHFKWLTTFHMHVPVDAVAVVAQTVPPSYFKGGTLQLLSCVAIIRHPTFEQITRIGAENFPSWWTPNPPAPPGCSIPMTNKYLDHMMQPIYSQFEDCARKSAHTALAVKACLLGGNSYTKCSITFVNIAVAISALAGGAKNGFAPRPELGGVFDIFRGFLGV